MPADVEKLRQHLRDFEFKNLLVEELGWNHYQVRPVVVSIEGVSYDLEPAAEKAGFVVYVCSPDQDGSVPPYPIRRKIERQIARLAYQHMIIFVDAPQALQIWQWVKREGGKPAICREQEYRRGQRGDPLIQRLMLVAFELNEEDKLGILDVSNRVQQALDAEKVTKRFYDRFRKELESFRGFIQGIEAQGDQAWYASLMLNRMMFVYFIQWQGFLDDDRNYLRNRLKSVQAKTGNGNFHQFYRMFLLRLFHEGLGQPQDDRAPELGALLGVVPYLNGGLFDAHDLERTNPEIEIPDEAFELIFDFFDGYRWHLDERPHRSDNEVNPDVLGYIFEKYINQKQMGAYYTKEDITGYMTRSTIIPFLFDAAQKECPIAFTPQGGVWGLLKDNPDRYVFPAIGHGIAWDARQTPPVALESPLELPEEIASGLNDMSLRTDWNRPAPEEYALPTETWREVISRRQRHQAIIAKINAGEIQGVDDLVTSNLDIGQFAEDVIVQSEGPELLRAFWNALHNVSILDPTCGSGAFLFAAMNLLEPLYTACIEGMHGFLDDLQWSRRPHQAQALRDFQEILEDTRTHPNLRYYVLKSIVINNLYGVDVMEEAVEICKLRLFLKLTAQVENNEQIEPLPDIDFNIRSGNTLVGFNSLEAVQNAMTVASDGRYRMLDEQQEETLSRIREESEAASHAFNLFRETQTRNDMGIRELVLAKSDLRGRFESLRDELDRHLAREYGVEPNDSAEYNDWRASHQPFHWFVEFHEIMRNGGFDVIIGNPPFVEYGTVTDYVVKGYETFECGNLYAYVCERSLQLLRIDGYWSLIMPVGSISSNRTVSLRSLLNKGYLNWISSFSNRPAKLFDGVEQRISIFVSRKLASKERGAYHSAGYQHWYSEERPYLFDRLDYAPVEVPGDSRSIPKATGLTHTAVLRKLQLASGTLASILRESSEYSIYYHNGPTYWIRAMGFDPNLDDAVHGSSHYMKLGVVDQKAVNVVTSILNSSLFYLYFKSYSNCRDFTTREITSFPFPDLDAMSLEAFAELSSRLMTGYREGRQRKSRRYPSGDIEYFEYYPGQLKATIDEIDHVLSDAYGLTPEELDYVLYYEAKYRHAYT